jgi:hypothetical protein
VPLFSLARLTAERVRSLVWQARRRRAGATLNSPGHSYKVHYELEGDAGPLVAPSWSDVEKVLDRLARAGATIPITPTSTTTIGGYERGRRVLLQSSNGPLWLAVDSIRECWERFEELGRIRRSDVLEPGRCSGFMIALFRQVPGVTEKHVRDTVYLVRGTS